MPRQPDDSAGGIITLHGEFHARKLGMGHVKRNCRLQREKVPANARLDRQILLVVPDRADPTAVASVEVRP